MNCAAGTYAYMRNIAGAAAKQDFAALCSHFKVLPWNSTSAQRVAGTMVAGIASGGAASVWMFAAQATAAEFNAWLAEQVEAGTPVTLAYERATPQAEALEAVEPISPQAGTMTVYTDADGLSATLYGSGWETVNDTEDVREGVSENADALYSLSSEFTQTRDAFEFRLNQTVNREEQSEYMRYGDGRLELGRSDMPVYGGNIARRRLCGQAGRRGDGLDAQEYGQRAGAGGAPPDSDGRQYD